MSFTDFERMKIAGNTEQNKQIDEMRKSWEAQQANSLLVSQLQTINNNLQKQIDEAKASVKAAEKDAQEARKTSKREFITSTAISIITFIVSVVSSFLIAKFF